MRGRFITLEGIDGAGKTTQLAAAAECLESCGSTVNVTREPGGTALGEALRALLLDSREAHAAETEALLMFAARREHIDKVIAPALARGEWVLCDRFSDASFAYQGSGSGVEWKKLELLERWVQGELQPDLTLYFDVSPDVARARAGAARAPDRFEQEKAGFHARVRAGYLRRVQEHPQRIRLIDAKRAAPEVSDTVREILNAFCESA
jgi:dTMP kinase